MTLIFTSLFELFGSPIYIFSIVISMFESNLEQLSAKLDAKKGDTKGGVGI